MRNINGERGQVLPFVAVCLLVLIGSAALAVDVGYLRQQQRAQQTAADSAAVAGAAELAYDPTQVTATARADATKNGYTDDNGVGNTVVTVNHGPATGPFAGNLDAVEVIVTAVHPAIFSSVFGSTGNTVSARAVAKVVPENPGACVFVMHGQWNANSPDADIEAPDCGVMVNGNVKSQNGTWNTPFIDATGWITATDSQSGSVETPNIPPFDDPCARVPGCAALAASFTQSNPDGIYAGQPYSVASGQTLNPGHYTDFSALSGTVTLNPGIYLVDSGDSTNATLVGTGVTIVSLAPFVNNGSNTNISSLPASQGAQVPPLSSTQAAPGVLFFIPSFVSGNMPWNSSNNVYNGMMYFPSIQVELNGNGSFLTTTFLVAGVIIGDQLTLTVPPNGGGQNFLQNAELVE